MKRYTCFVVLLFATVLLGQTGTDRPTPFGFKAGMSREAIIAAVGKENVKEMEPMTLTLQKAPKPNSDFDLYTVIVSPSAGLAKVIAGSTINANQSGEQVREKFSTIKASLTAKYGKPDDEFDFVHTGALFEEDNEFMMSLVEGERTLAATWTSLHNGTEIMLKVDGLTMNSALVEVIYEFNPEFDTAMHEIETAKQASY
jgi:hypothetical protein